MTSAAERNQWLKVAQEAALQAGQVLLDWQRKFTTREKGTNDFVTDADFASQEAIYRHLMGNFSDHAFLGEEDLGKNASLSHPGPIWVVDPLDGTANYVHQLQTYAVSIALVLEGKVELGVVYDPILRECFTAVREGGAFLNGEPLRTSGCPSAAKGMIAVSFSNAVPRGSIEISRFIETLHTCQSVRRLGSAALNLAYVAAGRLDGYFATSVKAWDIAAGVLLVEEAGGKVTDLVGGPLDLARPAFLATASSAMHAEMIEVLGRAEGV